MGKLFPFNLRQEHKWIKLHRHNSLFFLVSSVSFGKRFKFSQDSPISAEEKKKRKEKRCEIDYSYTTQSNALVLMVMV